MAKGPAPSPWAARLVPPLLPLCLKGRLRSARQLSFFQQDKIAFDTGETKSNH